MVCIKKNLLFLYTHIHSNYTTKKQLTEIIVQRDNVSVTYGTNIYLLYYSVLFICLKRHIKGLNQKMFLMFIITHLHNCYITKKQLISTIIQRGIVSVTYGTNVLLICPVRNAVFCSKRTLKKNICKMCMVFFHTHLHKKIITKKQLIWIICWGDIVNVTYGTTVRPNLELNKKLPFLY